MRKALIQGLIIIILFFSTWYIINRVDWMKVFRVEQATKNTEEKLGELFWDFFNGSETEIEDQYVKEVIDSLVAKLCSENKIDFNYIKLHILDKDEINAFALPDGHLVIYNGLILATENQEELCGVISHELAHIMLNHIMKRLVKETGLSVLISMTTGNSGTEIIQETAKMLSSSAFDRNIEKEADIKAVDYLIQAEINPAFFANFLYRLSYHDINTNKYLTWISSHPESRERGEYVIEYCTDKNAGNKPVLNQNTWETLCEKLRN